MAGGEGGGARVSCIAPGESPSAPPSRGALVVAVHKTACAQCAVAASCGRGGSRVGGGGLGEGG